jgi:hypothetical protein
MPRSVTEYHDIQAILRSGFGALEEASFLLLRVTGNLISAGEFLLGYQNEYGQYTRRPSIDPGLDPQNVLPLAEDFPQRRDLARNGSYLVLRHLKQDVHGFWRLVNEHSPEDGGVSLAEAIGRSYSTGDPLVPVSLAAFRSVGPEADDIRQNSFTFGTDPDGLACPFGAHIRRANPSNSDLPGGSGQSLISWLLRKLGLNGPREDVLSSRLLSGIPHFPLDIPLKTGIGS